MATQPALIAVYRVRQECRSVRTSGVGWLVVSILAGILSSGVGAYVVTGIAAIGVVYALGLIVASVAIEREVAR